MNQGESRRLERPTFFRYLPAALFCQQYFLLPLLLTSSPFTGVFACKPHTTDISLLGAAFPALLNKHMFFKQPQPRLKRLEGITDDFAV